MEETGNKTIICSVLFLDIVEYSKKSVSGQIALKESFNACLSSAIQSVALEDRIILDTGDGAAISFLGDIGDALKVALAMRAALLGSTLALTHPLLVCMGINLGPVRLVKDINGLPNIVGDGINVAQRVMGFADAGQILVSRSYYDAVSRLSQEYAGMFHYGGSRTDKHVREHEIYAIGHAGDMAVQHAQPRGTSQPGNLNDLRAWAKKTGQLALQQLYAWEQVAHIAWQRASPLKRTGYAGTLAIPLLIMIVLIGKVARHPDTRALPVLIPTHEVAVIPSANAQSAVAALPVPNRRGASRPPTRRPSARRGGAAIAR